MWTLTGDAATIRRTDERSSILKALAEAGEPMSPSELSAATGMSGNNLRQLLFKMAKAGEVQKAARGRYLHPDRAPPDNNDNKVTSELEGLE
jgi:hypothetical protein